MHFDEPGQGYVVLSHSADMQMKYYTIEIFFAA